MKLEKKFLFFYQQKKQKVWRPESAAGIGPNAEEGHTVPLSICAAMVKYNASQDRGQPVVGRPRTVQHSTFAAMAKYNASQDRGQPVVGRSRTVQHSTCAAMANSNVRVVGIRPVEIPAWC